MASLDNRTAATEAEIAHIESLTPRLFGGLVKIFLIDTADTVDAEIVGIVHDLNRSVVGAGLLLATVRVTAVDKNQVTLNLLARVESAFLEHRSEFISAGLMDLSGSSTIH